MAPHRGRARQCAFGRKEGIVRSAAPAQRGAAGDGVHLIDLNDYICPTARCAPVIGDVMVYRQGSHLTNTYARTLAPELTRQLAKYLD
jgi:hypothetical protein